MREEEHKQVLERTLKNKADNESMLQTDSYETDIKVKEETFPVF